ncbi:MAG TPA: DoxX family protein [Flavobacteriales bacterium]|nr:DoxX family protein [Flavobacteriales bacterium]
MKYFLWFCRIVVGGTFIVSGLVKANDPLGFSYKLEEYFAESALNLPFLEPASLFLAILACLAEVVLGFAVIVGGRMKLATACILWLTLFFGWLTAYTATCDPQGKYEVVVNGVKELRDVTCVTDCGCFGDAMKGSLGRSLTPWESFYKDLILLIFVLPLFFVSWFRKPRPSEAAGEGGPGIAFNTGGDDKVLLPGALILVALWCWVFGWAFFLWFTLTGLAGYLVIKRLAQGVKAEWLTALWITVFSLGFIWYCYAHLPLKDYRAYAVGKSISEQKALAKPPVNEIFLVYKDKSTGEEKEYPGNNYPWNDSVWVATHEFVKQRVNVIDPGVPSQVQDFRLTDNDGVDITDDVLAEPTPVLLIVVKTIGEANTSCLPGIKTLTDAASSAGWYVYGVTATGHDETEAFRHEHQLAFDFVTCDEITLKTMIRSNPGVVLLKEGRVMGQWHCNDVPSLEEAKKSVE